MGWDKLVTAAINALRLLFGTRLGVWVAAALAWLGISFASYKVVLDPALDQVRSIAQTGGAGPYAADAIGWMGVLKFDQAITMLLGAYAAKHSVQAAKLFLARRS